MYEITLLQEPNQYISFDIEENGYDLQLRTFKDILYADLYINGELLFAGRRCNNLMPLIQTNKIGNLFFKDKTGNENPTYNLLNDRFILIYDENYFLG